MRCIGEIEIGLGKRQKFLLRLKPCRPDTSGAFGRHRIDRREVRSSNGEREQRYVIETPIRIGDREWPIEVTLANRDMMSYRMLLGRRAIAGDVLVDPASSFLQPKLRYKLYEPAR